MLKITYLFHSGFLAETDECSYVFDYYSHGLEDAELNVQKPVIVLASHFHADHYDPAVFGILDGRGVRCAAAVLSKDIKPSRYPHGVEVIKAYSHNEYELPSEARLRTLLSTDSGVAYLLDTGSSVIYHAGDLNDWSNASMTEQQRRQMRGSFRYEIEELRGVRIDAAFVPFDPHLGDDYANGALTLLETADVCALYPMHYWQQPEIIERFRTEYPQYSEIIHDTENTKGEIIC